MDSIGARFATERKKRGLDFSDVEHAIGIRALYVQALEEGRYDTLPGEVYVKGFMRNYGNFLGLDGAQLVQEYSASKLPAQPPVSTQPTQSKVAANRSAGNKKTALLAVAFVLALAIAGGGLYLWQKDKPAPAARPSGITQNPPSTPTKLPPPAQTTPVPTPAVSAATRPVVLLAKFTDRCWTSAIADGKTIYEGIPKIGETLTWEADRQIIVNLGNAAAVEISFNGQPQGKMGERGDVVVKTFGVQTPPSANVPATLPAAPSASAPAQPVRP